MELEEFIEQDEQHNTTCDNELCIAYGDNPFCYEGRERECALYLTWEKRMIRKGGGEMRKNKKTIILAKIRSLIRKKVRRYNLGDELSSLHFWDNENYKKSKKVSKKKSRIGNYPYYSKSTRVIEDLAKEIYNLKYITMK